MIEFPILSEADVKNHSRGERLLQLQGRILPLDSPVGNAIRKNTGEIVAAIQEHGL